MFRGAGLVVVGATLHMMLPDRSVLLLPDIASQQFVYIEPQPAERPLVVERTTVFAPRITGPNEGLAPVRHAIVPASSLGVGPDFAAALTGSISDSQPENAAPIATSGSEPAARTRSTPDEPAPAAVTGVPYTKTAYALDIGATPAPTAPVVVRAADSAVRHTVEGPERATDPKPEPTPTEEELVQRLLNEYAGALERLDVQAAKSVYPSVNGKALKRAFEQVSAQRLTLQSCGITISGSTANARCQGRAAYHPKVGSRSVQIASGEWTFDLTKKDTDWRIVNTLVR